MNRVERVWPSLGLLLLSFPAGLLAQAPSIFLTDLTSGPNTGGEQNNGTIVTLYGRRFGDTQGSSTVTVGGGAVAAYLLWSDAAVSVAIGSAATTGNIVVHTSAGDSNSVPFTVRPGNIYCVSVLGDDGLSGQFPDQCWQTIPHAKTAMVAGDIAYIKDGVQQTTIDDDQAALSLKRSGGPGIPIALVAYPYASVAVGTDSMTFGIRASPATEGNPSHWVIAGLTLRATVGFGATGTDDFRLVANDISCPYGDGPTACVNAVASTNLSLLWNYIHDAGTYCATNCDLYNAVQFSTNSNHVEVGWNYVDPRGGCRAIRVNAAGGTDLYDLRVHDNLIQDAVCDGVNLETVDPTAGPVEVHNNVIAHVGAGPDPSGTGASYACVGVSGTSAEVPNVEVYNNTLYDCGARGNADSGGFNLYIPVRLRNNILRQVNSESYLAPNGGNCSLVSGTNNLWFGAGDPPSCSNLTTNVTGDPLFFNPPQDFHLQMGSPAIDSGVTIPELVVDIDGITRPQGSAYDLGAFEMPGGGPVGLLSANPASVNFGDVVVGGINTQTVTLTNTGTASVTISQASVTGAGFSITGLSLPVTLNAGQNVPFDASFAPTAIGFSLGNVNIVSNAANSPTNVPLSGNGVIPSHSVDLGWDASTSGVIGYNVYRGIVSGGPYTKINSSLVTGTTDTDTSVLGGLTYYYVVTAVDPDFIESVFSNEAQAIIPFP